MEIIVDHEKINIISRNLNNESDKLDIEINKLLDFVLELSSVWNGKDSLIFCSKANNYVTNLKQITHSIRNFSDFMKKADYIYKSNDNHWMSELKREDDKFE